MYYNSIYSQLFNFIPRYRFEKIVKKSGEDRYCKHFTAWKQFLTLLFAQISGKDSLREIENALLANHKRLYHLGMEAVAKSTLSEAMNRRNPEIFKALFEEILDRVMAVATTHKFKFKNPLYAIDSTTLDLCLSRYNWAYYRKHKGAIKLRENLSVYYQQFPHCSIFNYRDLQTKMANRTLFQMDQAEFEDKKLSRHKQKRCDVANLGGNDPLSADCLSQISAWVQVGNDGADKSYS